MTAVRRLNDADLDRIVVRLRDVERGTSFTCTDKDRADAADAIAQLRAERDEARGLLRVSEMNVTKFYNQWDEAAKQLAEARRSWCRPAVKSLRRRLALYRLATRRLARMLAFGLELRGGLEDVMRSIAKEVPR